jgi:hypothetical protein
MSHQQQDYVKGKLLLSKYAGAQSVPSTIIILHVKKIFTDNNVIQHILQKGPFSLRNMKIREGVFSPKAQKWYVCKVSCIAKKYITLIYT